MAAVFEIPSDFRAFMQQVVAYLDVPSENKFLDAEDALKHEVGYGGRIDGSSMYRFVYLAPDGHSRWELVMPEAVVREIADGLLVDVEGTRHDLVRTSVRNPVGEPVMIWGEYGDDALRIHHHRELITALGQLRESAELHPRMLRLWSACDDQVVAIVLADLCALYIVESFDGYATSCGDSRRNDSFEVMDHDGRSLLVPYADCVAWDRARNALINFVDNGNLGPEIRVEGRIPSQLLMMGDVDRKAALAARAEPPREITRSSLPRMLTPVPDAFDANGEPTAPLEERGGRGGVVQGEGGAESARAPRTIEAPLGLAELSDWARRLLRLLADHELIELGTTNLDELTYQLGGLLQAHGIEAQHSLDTAEWLANEIGAVRGVTKLFATGGDLQIALRRSRDV